MGFQGQEGGRVSGERLLGGQEGFFNRKGFLGSKRVFG